MGTLFQLHQYWLSKHKEDSLPGRSSIDPLDIPYALGELTLIDVVDGLPRDFIYRLIGTNLNSRLPSTLQGQSLLANPEPKLRDIFIDMYHRICDTKLPKHYAADITENKRTKAMLACIWPLASNGKDVDMLLCCREVSPPVSDEWWILAKTIVKYEK